MKTTQKQRIIDYIQQFGSISSWEAYADLGITQLGARIDQLKKDGYEFEFNYLSDSIEAISINTSILINGNHSFTFTEYNAQH